MDSPPHCILLVEILPVEAITLQVSQPDQERPSSTQMTFQRLGETPKLAAECGSGFRTEIGDNAMDTQRTNCFRDVPFMGVIRVVVEATKLGYSATDPTWSNLGQGQPEVGELPGAPPRLDRITIPVGDHAYGPVEGLPELREAVAAHYNRLYRRGMKSQYTADNVAIAAGGRTTLTRAVAALGDVRLGYFIPDYTAYEDLLSAFRQVTPVLVANTAERDFAIDPEDLAERVDAERLRALLISNPCNPTGRAIAGDVLARWVALARRQDVTLLLDEFYSHYHYDTDPDSAHAAVPADGPVSAAAFVEDVDRDPIVLFDGLTKSFRYPGWRLGWVVGPRSVVRSITAAGSFVDGGPPRPMQRAAIEVLEPQRADRETKTVRRVFTEKRNITVARLSEMGITFPRAPEGTFYAFGSIRDLPAPLNDGMEFYRRALTHRVLTVPGEFFDVNPGQTRQGRSPLSSYIRFSFGPPLVNLNSGLDRLAEMISSAKPR